MTRPSVSVVVPFAGGPAQARSLAQAFAGLQLRGDDELIAADNSVDGVLLRDGLPAPWQVCAAPLEGSPAYARNAGALHATCEWILFVDSDCRPAPDLLDRYFDIAPPIVCGLLAGAIEQDVTQDSLATRYAASRAVVDQSTGVDAGYLPFALTANLAVRRAVWHELGGLLEGIFNSEDVDFCWRAQRAGWGLEQRPDARVWHANRETVRGLMRQATVNRASARWVHRRWPDAPLPPLHAGRSLLRALVGTAGFLVFGQFERARLRALDGALAIGRLRGDVSSNRARQRPRPPATRRALEVWCDEFPVVSETFVVNEARALAALGHSVTVVAARRPERPALGVHDVFVHYTEDDTRVERARAIAWLLLRHPLRLLADRRASERWRAQENATSIRWLAPHVRRLVASPAHVHVHFAGGAALNALRVTSFTRGTWSVVGHGYDVFQTPRNLEEKVRRADLVIGPCAYTAQALRDIAGARAERVHEIVMGVDGQQFRRTTPYPATSKTVIAVGRLVEKKGLADLIDAATDPALAGCIDRVVVVGDGPLRDELTARIKAAGVDERVELRGRMEPAQIRDLLGQVAVLAMPCVIAADGDRDAMPVVVKEALAMEIPVVVTAEVGLPELVRPEFGRLVTAHDPVGLAAALRELMTLPPAQRAAMGRAGRDHVLEFADVATETAKLSALFDTLRDL